MIVRIPSDDTLSYGSIKQTDKCIDTLGHGEGQTVGFYECHGQGGNQVIFEFLQNLFLLIVYISNEIHAFVALYDVFLKHQRQASYYNTNLF